MNPQEILNHVAETYENCSFYCDSGKVSRKFDDEPALLMRFRTSFIRPSKFSLDWNDTVDKAVYSIQSSDSKTGLLKFNDKIESQGPLASVLSTARGISSTLTITIPAFILREDFRSVQIPTLLDWSNFELHADEKIGRNPCFHIRAFRQERKADLWICQKTFSLLLLRRVHNIGKPYQTVTTDIAFENVSFQNQTST